MTLKNYIYSRLPISINTKQKLKLFYYNNLLRLPYKIKYKIKYGDFDFFNNITIETTTYCNLRCEFCPNSKNVRGLLKNKKLIEINLFQKIVNELAEINFKGGVGLFFYGEPLTDKRLPELIAYLRKKIPNSKIGLNSNGTLLTIPLYKKLINAGVSIIHISQYTPKILPNMKEIFEYLKSCPKNENKITYRNFGKDSVLFNRGGEIDAKNISETPICANPENPLTIDYEGNVILCCNDYHSSIKFGNLKKEKLIDIWNKPLYKKIRQELEKGIYSLPICKKCVEK